MAVNFSKTPAPRVTPPKRATRGAAAGPGLSVKVRGAAATVRALQDLGERGADVSPAWPQIYDVLVASTKRHWASRGGRKWAPMAKITRETKTRKHIDMRLMRQSGKLYESLTKEGHRRQLVESDKTTLHYGTNIFYAKFQQQGTGHIPARDLIGIDRQARRQINDILGGYLVEGQAFVRRPFRA